MTDAVLRARPNDGGRLDVALADTILSDTSPLLVEIDRQPVDRWLEPSVSNSADLVTIDGTLAGTTLHAAWSARRVADQPVWELALTLRNDGEHPVTITRMDPLSLNVGAEWRTHGFHSAWGDEFRPLRGHAGHHLVLESRSGRSSHGKIPWLGLERGGYVAPGVRRGPGDGEPPAALTIAPAYSGNWHIHAMAGGFVTAGISPWQFWVDLAPGESVTAPSVVLTVASSLDTASLALQRAVAADWLPRTPFTDALPVEWNHWWPYEDQEVDEHVIVDNARIAQLLGIEVATVDAGWFGAADPTSYWQEQRGDWSSVNTARFPSGLEALGQSIRDAGVLPGMWIEAEAVGANSKLRAAHPEAMAHSVEGRRADPSYRVQTESLDPDDPTFLGYVCMGSPAGRAHVLESMSTLITTTGARWIKLDFNIDPDAGCTRTDHGHGAGDGLLRHYEGLYAVLDEVRARHPEIMLEACSSGGLRIDLGLARHVHGFFLSDPDYTEHHLQVLWGVRHLLPPIGILHWSWSQWRGDYPPSWLDWQTLSADDFDTTLRAAMLHRFGVSLRLPELRPELLERLRVHVDLFQRELEPFVREGVLLPLSESPERGGYGERAPSIQITHPDGRVLVAGFVLDGGARPRQFWPRGLEPETIYTVTDLADVDPRRTTGIELLEGGLVPLGEYDLTSWLIVLAPQP
ncbi:alpha-galactosidase [Microcella humidisoli]|uniref:alpha-galactosidase n=1 Tax=Microcella humidisoli TaxID=2963406 RepID=A0ABY5FYZ6_9MICO|nr:alpha-galactosidase [Microcella humidisoli]UTT63356.1 alpha-galactosidase [Microcella humidisoli]